MARDERIYLRVEGDERERLTAIRDKRGLTETESTLLRQALFPYMEAEEKRLGISRKE